ncbi:hypothetical protein [Cedecea davisae]|uniref:hypothetical protein n=1 Tax=Cedecea davisae TaxID=158484 RepID=UPI00311A5F27
MSAKSQFLKILQSRQSAPVTSAGKSQADVAEFRLRMGQLQEQMGEWLMGTGLTPEMLTTSVTDLLVEGGAFDISGIWPASPDIPIYRFAQGTSINRGQERLLPVI